MPQCNSCGKQISDQQYTQFNQLCPECEKKRQEIERKFRGDEEELSKYWYLWAIICIIGVILGLIYFITYPFFS